MLMCGNELLYLLPVMSTMHRRAKNYQLMIQNKRLHG